MAGTIAPNIITDGLILYLDAANTKSYVSGSTTWTDISNNRNNGTLINGPTFDTGSGGNIVCDGINDRIDVPRSLNGFTYNIHYDIDWTIECWMYLYTPDASPQTYKMIYGNYSGCNYSVYPGNATGFMIYNASNSGTVYTSFGFGPNSPSGCPPEVSWNTSESSWVYNLAVNKWCHFIMTSTDGTTYRIYVNGIQQGATKTFDFKNSANRTANNLAANRDYSWGGEFVGNGANQVGFSNMRMYNRPLSATEILQNYNTTKTRYGL